MSYVVSAFLRADRPGRMSTRVSNPENAIQKARAYEAEGFVQVRIRDAEDREFDVQHFSEQVWIRNS